MTRAVTWHLLGHLPEVDDDCLGIDMLVSFIKLSGVRAVEPLLIEARRRCIPVRVLTSTYMNITDPAALLALYDLLGHGSIRLYNGPAPSFHPKAYFFRFKHKPDCVFVGSSNLSESALKQGVEWNCQIDTAADPAAYRAYAETFERLFAYESYRLDHETIVAYRQQHTSQDGTARGFELNGHYRAHQRPIPDKSGASTEKIHPNDAQTEALIELKRTRKAGNDKAIVVAATGVGKTYLAALDALAYPTVLFVAHREEILNQAWQTFARLRESEDLGRLFAGLSETNRPVLFASVQSLSRTEVLQHFDRNAFSYIIVDEFHHASAASYQKILDYFQPEFLLGLTATPHRLDKKNIFAICDFNLVYEADLFAAINRGWLCPFHYLGIFDDTVDYSRISWRNGAYAEQELEGALSVNERANLVFRHYQAHKRRRTLAFCSSIAHADFMAGAFSRLGVACACVHSDSQSPWYRERSLALTQLGSGALEVIFSVDMLQEGVDVPQVDLLLFLRPTESATVFLQQLGRGLRRAEGKRNLKVLDFIGNYKKVDLIPFLFSRQPIRAAARAVQSLLVDPVLPDGCNVHFDLRTVDLIARILQSKIRLQDRIRTVFDDCRTALQHVPSRVAFYQDLENSRYLELKAHPRDNPFRDYNAFLHVVSPETLPPGYLDAPAHKLVRTIETTSMSALYKIPCIQAFIRDGAIRRVASRADLIRSFQQFYRSERHAHELLAWKSRRDYRNWQPDDYFALAKSNPVHFLTRTHPDVFAFDPGTETFRIVLDLGSFSDHPYFLRDIQDALDFRRNEFIDLRLDNESS
ncbi:MAG: DEAD/DEAH box helicase family protein [Eubacteriales bacterium]|jgi:superfamily II DNA or RNA helicase|nr:DEAD/DEAH box helicase family protein [Eubacteriales bacterium]